MKTKFSTAYLIRSILLIVGAIVINIGIGVLVRNVLLWPVYLDSVGTILVGALFGPLAGAATGAVSNIIWGLLLNDPKIIPYSITAAFIGWAAGYAVSRGAFKRFYTVILSGLLVGFGAALISAPITAYLNKAASGGTVYLTSLLTATGANILQATTITGLISDPIDKMISFTIAWLLWRLLARYFQPPSRRGVWSFESLSGYSLAVVVNLLALLLCFIFLPAFERGIFHIFYLAVVLVAWRSGRGPAILTTFIGAVAQIVFLMSSFYRLGITAQDWLRVGIFILVSLAIATIADQLSRSQQNLMKSLQAERENQARIRAITDSVNEALLLVSIDQRILAVNKVFLEFFNVPQERITGQHLEDTRTLIDQIFTEADNLYELILTRSKDVTENFTQLAAQNWPQKRELQLYSTPVRDEQGFLGRLFVFRDVTHEREVDRMKTEFVSLVSHELRTPLTSIKGYTEMVLDGDAGDVNEEVQEYLGIVFSNAERLVALVNDLLDVSRIESGRIQIKSETVDLNEVVQNVVISMQQKIDEKKQTLTVDIDPLAASVTGDKAKLIQIVMNYVSNAYKYTQESGDIHVEIGKQDGFAHVAVRDNGFGIPPEDQAKLFTRFYRVDNSMTREVGGTGLGLSIVKQLIELQGGVVGVESALGKGSTFFFTIPLAVETGEAVEEEAAAPEVPVAAPEETATILVVEDDNDTAQLIARYLEKAGYHVRIVHTAEEALADLKHQLPDLITLDIDLPGMHGDELARKIQADVLTKDIPVLFVSIYGDDQLNKQFNALALPKPIDQQELLSTVAQMLQGSHQDSVLVIDDDIQARIQLEAALKGQGFQVAAAGDGESGLAQASEQRPGLILLDMSITGMDGFAILRALKENRGTSDIPVIAMTGSADLKSSARARVLSLGASDFIAKPLDMNMLVTEIKLFLTAD